MTTEPYVTRVVLKPQSGQGDPGGYVLVGTSADLRSVLEDLLAAVMRFDGQRTEPGPRFHSVVVGDATARYDYTYLAVHDDADVDRHRSKTRSLWRFYDSQLAGLIALMVMLLAIVGANTVWGWLFGV